MTGSRRIFVAGATGVLGRRVVPRLVAAGHAVTAVARSPQKRAAIGAAGATPIGVDLFDADAVQAAVAGHDVVVNLATRIPPGSRALLPWTWRENDRLRRTAARNLAAAARTAGVRRFVQESIAMIYAGAGDAWLDEDARVQPARHTRSALDAEAAAAGFARTGGEAVVLRIAYLYGADSDFTRDAVRAARKGWATTLGAADAFVSSVSSDDAAAAIVAALEVPPGTYNVCDDEPLRRRDHYAALAEALGVAPPRLSPAWLARVMGPVGETVARSQRVSNRKLREASGWAPRLPSVREGWRAVVTELRAAAGAR